MANVKISELPLATVATSSGLIPIVISGITDRITVASLMPMVTVLNYGADPTGVSDSTTAFVNALAASRRVFVPEGTYLVDAVTITGSGYVLEGASPTGTILKARTSASTRIINITGGSSFATNNIVRNMTLNMTNMTDSSASSALHLAGTYDDLFEQLFVTGNGSNKLSLSCESSPATFGVYTSTFVCCDFGSTTGRLKFNGNGTSDAVTTLTFIGCSFANCSNNFGYGLTFVQPIIQGALTKFDLANTRDLSIYSGDVEGTGTYLAFGSSCVRVFSQGNQTQGFSGTYTSGTCDPMFLNDLGQVSTWGFLTMTMYAGGHSDRPISIDTDVNIGIGLAPVSSKFHVYNVINQTTARLSDNFNNRRLSYVGTSLRQAQDSDGTAQPLFTGIASTDITELNSTYYRPVTDNSVNLGDGTHRWKEVFAVAGTINTSDAREKNSVQESDLGLDFVKRLRPVSYKWNIGGKDIAWEKHGDEWVANYIDRPGNRVHYGLIASEVKSAAGNRSDFGAYVLDNGVEGLRYSELIAPLIKAIQELSAKVDAK